jgi:hypothetical protein
LLYPESREDRDSFDLSASRFAAPFDAFRAAGMVAEPSIWHDGLVDDVARQRNQVALVFVYRNPIEDGCRRDRLEAAQQETARQRVIVSADSEVVQRIGTMGVPFATRQRPSSTSRS